MGLQVFYEKYAESSVAQVDSKKVMAIARHFLKPPVLDVGCFFGDKTKELSKWLEADGCDISRNAIKGAAKKYGGLVFFACDFEKPGLRLPKRYNSIFAAEVIEHMLEPGAFLKNCFASLNSGGILLLTTPNVACLMNRLRLLAGDPSGLGGIGHVSFFNPKSIAREAEKAGFEILLVEGYNVGSSSQKAMRRTLRRVFQALSILRPVGFSEGTILVAKKP